MLVEYTIKCQVRTDDGYAKPTSLLHNHAAILEYVEEEVRCGNARITRIEVIPEWDDRNMRRRTE